MIFRAYALLKKDRNNKYQNNYKQQNKKLFKIRKKKDQLKNTQILI